MKNRKFCARYGYMGMGEGVGRGVLSPPRAVSLRYYYHHIR